MLNYNSSPPAAMVATQGQPYAPPNDPGQTNSIRDILSGVIGRGFTDLKSDDARNAYAYLRGSLGPATASKLMTHALLFNQRPDMLKANPEQKVQSFYDIGSNDPEVHTIIKRAGNFGQGPVEGLNTSPDAMNMQASRRKQFTSDVAQKAGTALSNSVIPILKNR
jgi:hypothetical protein